jgi:DNA repair exonuclease SbcCD ATPase subunit
MSLLFPRGTPKAPIFFDREDDDIKEPDHVQDKLAAARRNLSRAKRELESAQKELTQVQQLLDDTDSQAAALADSLSRGISSTPDHAAVRHRVARLTIELEDLQYQISDAQHHCQPPTIAQLERKRADVDQRIESLRSQLSETQQAIRDSQFELFGIFASENWRQASDAAADREIADRVHVHLQSQVKRALEAETTPAPSEAQRELPVVQRLLHRKMELEQPLHEAQFQRCCAQIRRRVTIATLLDDLTRLDTSLRALGQEGFSLSDLRKKYLPEGPLSPLKRPKSSGAGVRKGEQLTVRKVVRPNSDLKRPLKRV